MRPYLDQADEDNGRPSKPPIHRASTASEWVRGGIRLLSEYERRRGRRACLLLLDPSHAPAVVLARTLRIELGREAVLRPIAEAAMRPMHAARLAQLGPGERLVLIFDGTGPDGWDDMRLPLGPEGSAS